MDLQSAAEILRLWAHRSDCVQRLWLYGSRVPGARRPARPDSDLDVAIEVLSTPQNHHWAWFYFEHETWETELRQLLPFDVHLTHYNPDVPPDYPVEKGNVKTEIDRYGYLVYDRATAPAEPEA